MKEDSKLKESVVSLKKAIEIDKKIRLNKYIELSNFKIEEVETELVNSAVADNKNDDYISASKKLRTNSIFVVNIAINRANITKKNWIYFLKNLNHTTAYYLITGLKKKT